MTLIEMVRKARNNDHRWVATDEDGEVYSYHHRPFLSGASFNSSSSGKEIECLGYSELTCDWKDSLIDVDALRGIK